MQDEQLLRYSRQIMLPEVDIDGQETLLKSTVLIVGLGGLGSPVALYLAAAGVGHLKLADFDEVDLTNLQRQIAHTQADVGQLKVDSAANSIQQLNDGVKVTTITSPLEGQGLLDAVANADAVVDCTDNFAIRFALNEACVNTQTPLISGAAIRLEGQVAVYDSRNPESPCYRCLYQEGEDAEMTCSETGVLAPLVGMIGTTQALETLKVLIGFGQPLVGRLLLLDAKNLEWRTMKLKRDPDCPVCAAQR